MSNKVLVTGGSGFIGKQLLIQLCDRADVTEIWALSRSQPTVNHPKIQWRRGDLRSLGDHSEILCQVDMVFHLGAVASYSGSQDVNAINADSMTEFVRILSGSSQLRSFVFVSSIGAVDRADGDRVQEPLGRDSIPQPRSDYGKSKLTAEQTLQRSSLPWVIVRPTWVYGKEMRSDSHLRVLSHLVAQRKPVTYLKFPGAVGVVHVQDLAASLIQAATHPRARGQIYYAQTEVVTFTEIFSELHRAWGHRQRAWIPVPPLQFLFRRWHRFLPLQVSNLFIPYLTADSKTWCEDLAPGPRRVFSQSADEIIAYEKQIKDAWHVITGANSGIGRALAQFWGERKLILIDKNLSSWTASPQRILHQVNLSEERQVDLLAEELRRYDIAVFVNNAGVGFKSAATDTSSQQISTTILVNTLAPMLLVQKLAPRLIQSRACIVNVASSVGFFPLPGMSVYAASKAAVVSWSESLGVELAKTNQVVTFCPSGTATGFQIQAGVRVDASQKLKTPEQVAQKIDQCVTAGRSVTYVPSGLFRILYGVSHILPRQLVAALWGALFRAQR